MVITTWNGGIWKIRGLLHWSIGSSVGRRRIEWQNINENSKFLNPGFCKFSTKIKKSSFSVVEMRYLTVLYNQSVIEKNTSIIMEELNSIADLIHTHKDLESITFSDSISEKAKSDVWTCIGEKLLFSTLVKSFLCVVFEHKRSHILYRLNEVFETISNTKSNITKCLVSSAVELSSKQKESLEAVLKKKFSHLEFIHEYLIDKEVLGSFTVKFEDKLLDLSIATRLSNFKKALYG